MLTQVPPLTHMVGRGEEKHLFHTAVEDPDLWNQPRSTKRRQRENKVLQKSVCETFFTESSLFLRSINLKETGRHMFKDLED